MQEFTYPLVETEALEQLLGEEQLRILDCSVIMQQSESGGYEFVSGQAAWQEGHIPGSIYVDPRDKLSHKNHHLDFMMPEPDDLMKELQKLGVGQGCAVVLYDRGNHAWAARVWWMLRACGFDNAAVLNGGFRKWSSEGRKVSNEEVSYPPCELFKCQHRKGLMADMQEVHKALDDPSVQLVHSLPEPTFTGEVAPYGRAGRIPGSCNVYCETVLDQEAGTYPSAQEIRDRFKNTGVLEADRVIAYCGGGVAASSNALALTCIGLDNVAVYDGSLSEWAANEDMPMETGPA